MVAGENISKIPDWEAIGKYFVVRDLASSFDGLEVKVSSFAVGGALAEVSVIRRPGVLFGDRPLQEAVAPGTLFFSKRVLFLSKNDREMEFTSKGWGRHVSTKTFSRGSYVVVVNSYEHAVSVDVNDMSTSVPKKLYERTCIGDRAISDFNNALDEFVMKSPTRLMPALLRADVDELVDNLRRIS